MPYEALELHVADHVATIKLMRPELLNRFDVTLHREFATVLNRINGDADVRAVLLTSTGKVFSAGGDFELMRAAHDSARERRATVEQARAVLSALTNLVQPIVVALQGPVVGLGATVVLACDAVVAVKTASLSDAHVAMALVAGDGGALVWPQAAGMLRARRYLLTGDAIDAERAYQFGLVTDLVDTVDELAATAAQLARKLASLPHSPYRAQNAHSTRSPRYAPVKWWRRHFCRKWTRWPPTICWKPLPRSRKSAPRRSPETDKRP